MEVRVGIQNITREIVIKTDASAAEIEHDLTTAVQTSADGSVLKLNGEDGNVVLIPVSALAYVELGQEHARQVGFGSV